eukprot:s1111_g9.t1
MQQFIKFGDQFGNHVKPQSEHLAPVSAQCALKLDFIGKSEHLSEDWRTFFEAQHCASEPQSAAQLVSAAQAERSTSTAAIRAALDAENSAYLRAFCWIHLADYVIFDYDLPKGCDEEEMLKIDEEGSSDPLVALNFGPAILRSLRRGSARRAGKAEGSDPW